MSIFFSGMDSYLDFLLKVKSEQKFTHQCNCWALEVHITAKEYSKLRAKGVNYNL